MKNTLKALLFGLLLVGASVTQVNADWTEETTFVENSDLDEETGNGLLEDTTSSDADVVIEEDLY